MIHRIISILLLSSAIICSGQDRPDWKADLPMGYPTWDQAEKQALRQKGQATLKAIREASIANAAKIVIPPGDCLFHADWSKASTLNNLKDLEVIAEGVTFWFEPPMVHGLLFENCKNVTVRGLTIDFSMPTWSQAGITEIDLKNKTILATPMEGYAPRNKDGKLEQSGERKMIFYDKDGHFINHRHTRGDWKLAENGTDISYTNIRVNPLPAVLKVGDYVVSPIQTGAALRSKHCEKMLFENVNVWSSPGMAVYEGGGVGGHIYKRVRATRSPKTNRLQAFGADIFHLSNTDHGPTLDHCEMAYGADDSVNIHGSLGRVVKRQDDHHYYLEGSFAVGDTLEFREFNTVELLGIAKVVSVKKVADPPVLAINDKYNAKGEFLVKLSKPLRLPLLSLIVLDGKRSASGFVIRNCWIHDNFQRTLINGSPNGIIENNTLQNVGHGIYIQFETWGPWMEGPFARNLIIRNNRFLNSPPDGDTIRVSMHPKGASKRHLTAMPVTNMTITGNYFGSTTTTSLNIRNVSGLKIHDNRIATSSKAKWYIIKDCENVSIQNNVLTK